MAEAAPNAIAANSDDADEQLVRSMLLSGDIVIGLIGYAGAGCTDVYKRLKTYLSDREFEVTPVRLSKWIEACTDGNEAPHEDGDQNEDQDQGGDRDKDQGDGKTKLERTIKLQDFGDKIRKTYGGGALASLAIREIKQIREGQTEKRRAIVIDSLKHPDEVELLRLVYENSFRLLGVYCGKNTRNERLRDKFYGADPTKISYFMDRDERDPDSLLGQQVRRAFHQADFFLDNNSTTSGGDQRGYDTDLERFVSLMEGGTLVRPRNSETAMYAAYSASLKSSCLSRQVGAALTNQNGEVLATGSNEVPAFGGGVYHDGHEHEQFRCFKWKWWEKNNGDVDDTLQKPCCHNTRKKNDLKSSIAGWLAGNIPQVVARKKFPLPEDGKMDLHEQDRNGLENELAELMDGMENEFVDGHIVLDTMPGIGDLIEFSRSIHAEMDAVLGAARAGADIKEGTLYVTTYPCHSCARHLVAAGIKEVRFLEPYDKSLAVSLHWDSIENEGSGQNAMSILPYTGVGPRVYAEYFLKRGDIKDDRTGMFRSPDSDDHRIGVRLFELGEVEKMAIRKVPAPEEMDI